MVANIDDILDDIFMVTKLMITKLEFKWEQHL
jgi:hypothetical protein